MATSGRPTAPELEIRRTIEASPEAIYRAWTEAATLSRWFAPSGEYTTHVRTLETRVGGPFRIELHHRSGRTSTAIGVFRELARPNRLSFTWRWEEREEMTDSIVELFLEPKGTATELRLVHRLLVDETDRDNHEKGWNGCLERLGTIL